VDLKAPQIKCCIICYNSPILDLNPTTKTERRLIIYYTTNGIIALKKTVNLDHCSIYKKIDKEVNSLLRKDERQLSKKRPNVSFNSISIFFATKKPFKKYYLHQ